MKFLPLIIFIFCFFGCKRYEDPAPFTDPRIANKYCNTPSAINYNWNFPGVPDSTTCIFPAEIFNGTYLFHDSIFNSVDTFLSSSTYPLTFDDIDTSHFNVTGFCTGITIKATANRYFKFTIDTLVGNGQALCLNDTISGKGSKNFITDTTIHLEFEVLNDTGTVYHAGTAFKQ